MSKISITVELKAHCEEKKANNIQLHKDKKLYHYSCHSINNYLHKNNNYLHKIDLNEGRGAANSFIFRTKLRGTFSFHCACVFIFCVFIQLIAATASHRASLLFFF